MGDGRAERAAYRAVSKIVRSDGPASGAGRRLVTPELIMRMVQRSTAESGVPERLEDPVIARKVAVLLGAHERPSARRSRAA